MKIQIKYLNTKEAKEKLTANEFAKTILYGNYSRDELYYPVEKIENELETEQVNIEHLLEQIFSDFNLYKNKALGIRSMSVGDLVIIDDTCYVVASFGFNKIRER